MSEQQRLDQSEIQAQAAREPTFSDETTRALREDYIFVTAIDFGTTFSGYAYSTRNDYQLDERKVSAPYWETGGVVKEKTVTCILFDENGRQEGRYHSCGYEALEKYKILCQKKENHKWFFFKNYKMKLYDNMDISYATQLKTDDGKEMPAHTVFSETIRFFVQHFKTQIEKQYLFSTFDHIRWVLTVPTIWNDKAKQFMRKAAEDAGIPPDQLLIALEPEAAALYCKTLPIQTDDIFFSVFKPQTKFMVLDLGGGTYDITVNMMSPQGLEELHVANGGEHGGNNVNSAFWGLLAHLFSSGKIDNFRKEHPEDELYLEREFESKKMTIKGGDSRETLNIHLPPSLCKMIKQDRTEVEATALSKSLSRNEMDVDLVTSKLKIDIPTAQRLFHKPTMEIYRAASGILADPNFLDLNFVLMVGGFSESPYLHQRLEELFRRDFSKIQVLRPVGASNAVLRGAVTFGHDPSVYKKRICRYTYGIKTNAPFQVGHDPANYATLNDKGEKYCNIRFSKLVTIGDELKTGEYVGGKLYQPFQQNQKKVTFPVYISIDRNPRFVTECEYLGILSITLSELSKRTDKIKIEMKLGETELATVRATEMKTGREASAALQFLG